MAKHASSEPKRGSGRFSGRQLTVIMCVAIVSLVVIVPTAALAATGAFTSTTIAPAVSAANGSNAANAVGVLGRAIGTGNVARTGIQGTATGGNGVGVHGTGAKWGLYSSGPLGVSGHSPLVCGACVTGTDIANRIVVHFNLAAGANSAPIAIPANVPVQVMGATLTSGVRGVTSVSLLRIPNNFIEWTGLEASGTVQATITGSYSSVAATHIAFIDYSHLVDIQVNDANRIRIHNGSGAARSGLLVITW